MTYKHLISCFLFCQISCTYCQDRNNLETKDDCKILNNTGYDILLKNQLLDKSYDRYDSCIYYFEAAITCDSNYIVPWQNLLTTYSEMAEYNKCIFIIDRLQSYFKLSGPLLIADKAYFCYLSGDMEAFEINRNSAIVEANRQLEEEENIQNFGQIVQIRSMLFGREDAIEYVNSFDGEVAIERLFFINLINDMPQLNKDSIGQKFQLHD